MFRKLHFAKKSSVVSMKARILSGEITRECTDKIGISESAQETKIF